MDASNRQNAIRVMLEAPSELKAYFDIEEG